jgi:Repeat of unknown function (DUF346)
VAEQHLNTSLAMRLLVAASGVVLALLLTAAPARAEERQFCWGAWVSTGDSCASGTWYMTGAFANSTEGPVCLYLSGHGLYNCGRENEGVYVGGSQYGVSSRAYIFNWSTSHPIKVHGTFWTAAPAPPSPPPVWQGPEDLGGNIQSDPDISSWGVGRLDVFARGTDNALKHRWYNIGEGWSAWESLGGTLASGPGAVSWGPNRIDVVARATNNTLMHWWYDGIWHNENLGGNITSAPDIASWADGRLDVFARGADNSLQHRWYVTGSGWSSWESLGGILASGPGAVSWGPNRIDIVARATDNNTAHWWYDGSWHIDYLGQTLISDPDIASSQSGRLDVFAQGSGPAENQLEHKFYSGSWSGWESLGGSLVSGPGAASWGEGRIDVVGRTSSGTVTHWWYD